MTIPHVAIVAGCLLAGNNPNTLEIIVSSEKGGPWEGSDVKARRGFRKFYLPYYQSVYVPVEMWARGKNKKLWIDELIFRYGATPTSKDAEGRGKHVARHNKGEFHFDLWDWIWMVNITIGLMVLPFALAFLTVEHQLWFASEEKIKILNLVPIFTLLLYLPLPTLSPYICSSGNIHSRRKYRTSEGKFCTQLSLLRHHRNSLGRMHVW